MRTSCIMLSDLPPEIVSEIASHLSYRDIITLRKALTREDLHCATNAHTVWLNLASQYLAENPHSDLSQTCVSSLTTNQLRHRFERRLIVNDIWRLSSENYPSIKRLRCPPSPLLTVDIAPGGRWAFGGTNKCMVFYWDLDSDDPEPLVLMPPDNGHKTPGRRCVVTRIGFLVEHGDPLSGFLVAFVGCDLDSWYYGKSHEWIYIWNVIPHENGTLEAEHLKTLPVPYEGFYLNFSFNGHLAARSMKKRVDVYWWRDCTETHLVRCTLLFEKRLTITNIYVLGSDKLLVYTRDKDIYKGRLYTMEPEHSKASEYQEAVSHATKIWSFRFQFQHCGSVISRLYFNGTNYRQTIATFDGIYSLTIPASQDNKTTLVKVSDFDRHQQGSDARLCGLGLSKGYCRASQRLYRFGYNEGSIEGAYENSAAMDSKLCRSFELLQSSSFDEELGRLVSVSQSHLDFQDFSLPLYNAADVCPDSDDTDEFGW